MLLVGEPGMGKTRLAAELLALAHPRAITLSARAFPLGATASFGLWAEALEGHLRSLPPAEVVAVCGGFLDDLAGLLHSVAAARGSVPEQAPPRLRLLEAVAVVLSNLARQESVVIVLDDVHLADSSSWEALHYQEAIYQRIGGGRRRALHRVVGRSLLASGRPGEAAPHFSRSTDLGDREAIEALCEALRQAEQRETDREALEILGALVELVPSGDGAWTDVAGADVFASFNFARDHDHVLAVRGGNHHVPVFHRERDRHAAFGGLPLR